MDENLFPDATLDPPGSIAVVGAGPLGLEAALYGRYLGYDVTVIESVAVASQWKGEGGDPIPMLPDRCASPLALSALRAQQSNEGLETLPVTMEQWVTQIWMPLVETDLLRGRLRCPALVTRIEHVAVEIDETEEVDATAEDEDLPPDFRLTYQNRGEGDAEQSLQVEAVILATQSKSEIQFGMELPCEYLFEIGSSPSEDAGADFAAGLKQIVALYASLGGRPDLDLYRPKRG